LPFEAIVGFDDACAALERLLALDAIANPAEVEIASVGADHPALCTAQA
jgi:hypothetical protein